GRDEVTGGVADELLPVGVLEANAVRNVEMLHLVGVGRRQEDAYGHGDTSTGRGARAHASKVARRSSRRDAGRAARYRSGPNQRPSSVKRRSTSSVSGSARRW